MTLILAMLLLVDPSSHQWTQWGGENRDFVVSGVTLADTWPEPGPKQIWKRELGPGYSGMVSRDGVLYTGYKKDDRDIWIAMKTGTGKTLWEYSYPTPEYPEKNQLQFGKGPNATPLLLQDRLICIGFTAQIHCVSLADGKLLWSHDLMSDFGAKKQRFGYSASPLLYKGQVLVQIGGQTGLISLSPKDGSVLWKSGPLDLSYASPKLFSSDGVDQILLLGAETMMGVDARNGKPQWSQTLVNDYKNNATDPIVLSDNRIWVASQMEAGTRLIKASHSNGKTQLEELWHTDKVKYHHSNAVVRGEYAYVANGGSVNTLSCVSLEDGRILWRERGYNSATLLAVGDKLISLDLEGKLSLLKANPKGLQVLGKMQVTHKPSRTPPILLGKNLFVRDQKVILGLALP